jgi:DNA-binding CsgD family transcriptional regulator
VVALSGHAVEDGLWGAWGIRQWGSEDRMSGDDQYVEIPPTDEFGSATLIGLAEKLADDEQFATSIAEHRDRLELQHASYGFVNTLRVQVPSCNTYPNDWTSFYYQEGFHTLDPLISALHGSRRPTFLDELERIPAFRTIWIEHAGSFGIGPPVIGVPMSGPHGETSVFLLHGEVPAPHFEFERKQILRKVITRAMEFHEEVMNTYALSEIMGRPKLSPREIHCLELTAQGHSVTEVGRDAGISVRTVESHLKACRQKLDAKSTSHAVARAVYMGMIAPA